VKIGAKVVRRGRHVIFQMAEVAVPKELFQEILRGSVGCDQGSPSVTTEGADASSRREECA
jgi:hypothetical protein